MSVIELAKKHCQVTKPALTLDGSVQCNYGVKVRFLHKVASGERPASSNLLRRLDQAHTRLFPSEPVLLTLPNQPPVLLGHQN